MTSADDCLECPPGSACGTGAVEPSKCSPGTVAPNASMATCDRCAPGKFQPNSKATSCLPCEDDHLGVYCPNAGTSTPTPCPGGTYSNETGLYSEVQCSSVKTGYYASTGSKYPEPCPASGFTCPGRALDEVNDPPGSKPILVVSGQASVDVEMETVTFDLEVDMHLDDYNEAVVIAELAALYGVSEELISVEVAPISDRRKLSNDTAAASGAAQRLRLTVTILVPKDFVDGMADVLDTESSLTAADGASSSPDVGGLVTSTAAGRLANRLNTVNSAGGSSLSAALGFNVTLTQEGLVETVSRQVSASCAPGYWCSAANAIPCVPNTFQPEIDQIDAGACQQCPEDAVSPKASKSIDSCKCKPGYYDSEPAINELRCVQCKTGSDCSTDVSGVTLETLPLLPGYYRISNASNDLRRCPDFGHNSGCVGGVGSGEGPCKEWLAGPYCRLCNVTDRTRYFSADKSACLACKDDAGVPLALGFSLLIVVLSILLLWLRFKPHRNVHWLVRLLRWMSRLSAQLALRPKGKQLLSFYQVATRVGDVYEVKMPSAVLELLSIFEVLNINVAGIGLPLQCFGLGTYQQQLATTMLAPLMFAAVIVLGFVSRSVCSRGPKGRCVE